MTIPNLIMVGGYVIAGVLAIIGLFSSKRRTISAENDVITQNLITNLKTTNDEQAKKITVLEIEDISKGKQIARLEGQLATVEKVLQGRDPAQEAFFQQAPVLIKISQENHEMTKNLTGAITELIKKLTPVIQQ